MPEKFTQIAFESLDTVFTCEHCGSLFTRSRKSVRDQTRLGSPIRFCSRECANASMRGSIRKELTTFGCAQCGSDFQIASAQYRAELKRGRKGFYCGRECANAGLRKVPVVINGITTQQCSKCHEFKALDAFSPDKASSTGRTSWCKRCCADHQNRQYRNDPNKHQRLQKQRYWANPERHRAYARERNKTDHARSLRAQWTETNHERIALRNHEWYLRNKDHAREVHREYRRNNPDKVLQMHRSWRERNKVKMAETARLWTARNRERIRHNQREYRRNNHEKYLATKRAYRSANRDRFREYSRRSQRSRRVNRTPESIAYSEILRRDPCSYCGQYRPIAVDHIVPVSKGGGSEVENLTAACYECNGRKSHRSLLEFLMMPDRKRREAA